MTTTHYTYLSETFGDLFMKARWSIDPFIYIQFNYSQNLLIIITLNSFFSIIVNTFRSQHTELLPVHWIYSDSESQCWHCRVKNLSWNATATLFRCSSAVMVHTLNCHICFHTSAAKSGQRFNAALSPFTDALSTCAHKCL